MKRLEGKVAAEEPGYLKLIRELQKQESYKTHFLIPAKGDKFIPIAAEDILYFYIAEGNVKAVDVNQKEYMFPQTLDELADSLNPHHFFRANRQYILSKKVIKDIDLWFNNRLSVNLKVPVAEKILISKANPTSTFPPQNFPVIQHLQFLHIYCGYYKFSNSTELG